MLNGRPVSPPAIGMFVCEVNHPWVALRTTCWWFTLQASVVSPCLKPCLNKCFKVFKVLEGTFSEYCEKFREIPFVDTCSQQILLEWLDRWYNPQLCAGAAYLSSSVRLVVWSGESIKNGKLTLPINNKAYSDSAVQGCKESFKAILLLTTFQLQHV